jgi:hypothetical protein
MPDDAPHDLPTTVALRQALDRKAPAGVMIRIGQSRWTVPTVTIIMSCLSALGIAYRIVDGERKAIWQAIEQAQKRDEELQQRDRELNQRMEIEQVVLADIRTQLARIDARVAEVQVTLMRGGR